MLREAITTLGEDASEIIVVGGWGPFLRNREQHPGTKDVDLLFPSYYDRDEIGAVIKRFLEVGFLLSAKHNFQLFRPYAIGKQTYVYNVDLLHPVIQNTNKVEFVDVLDLDVTLDGTRVKTVDTICIEGGDIFFLEQLVTATEYQGLKFRTLSPVGVVLSKLRSCHNPKRPRDIFDIYLALSESKNIERDLEDLASRYGYVQSAMDEYKGKLACNWAFYEECLRDFAPPLSDVEREALKRLIPLI